jgi:hypothetical protein
MCVLEWSAAQKATQGLYSIDDDRLRILQATPHLFDSTHTKYFTSEDFMRTADASIFQCLYLIRLPE